LQLWISMFFITIPKKFFAKIFDIQNIYIYYKIIYMKKIDKANLFDLFDITDEQVYEEHGISDVLHDSYILFGMAIKGVENYYIMEQMYRNRYGQQFNDVQDGIKTKYFTQLMRYIDRIDISHVETMYQYKDILGQQSINYALTQMIQFFEQKEMYEHCAVLLKFFNVFFGKNSC